MVPPPVSVETMIMSGKLVHSFFGAAVARAGAAGEAAWPANMAIVIMDATTAAPRPAKTGLFPLAFTNESDWCMACLLVAGNLGEGREKECDALHPKGTCAQPCGTR